MNSNDPRVLRVAEALVALFDATRPPAPAYAAPTHYVSARCGPHPPGKSARWCRDNFRHVAGARKEGRDWVVSAHDYDAWITRIKPRHELPPPRPSWSPALALESVAIRPQRGEP